MEGKKAPIGGFRYDKTLGDLSRCWSQDLDREENVEILISLSKCADGLCVKL